MKLRFWLLCAVSIAGMLIGTSGLAYSSHKNSVAAGGSPCTRSSDCFGTLRPYCCCINGPGTCTCQSGEACQ